MSFCLKMRAARVAKSAIGPLDCRWRVDVRCEAWGQRCADTRGGAVCRLFVRSLCEIRIRGLRERR